MWFLPGRRITVSLTDGSALSGVTRLTWLGRVKLGQVSVSQGDVPGTVFVYSRAVLTIQVVG